MEKNDTCNCPLCIRTRNYREQLEKIPDPEVAEWFKDFYSYVCGVEEDLECYKIYNKNLKTLYPKIWNETTTIQPLEKDDAKYPERQL